MNNAPQKHGYSLVDDESFSQRKRHKGPELLDFEHLTDVTKHVYSALPPERKRIRLLRLFAGVLENPQINCEMFEAEFDGNGILRHLDEVLKKSRLGRKEPYHALSWRWGDEDDGKYAIMIKRDGNLFKKRVSRTLGLALKYLRLKQDRVLWIDAICIDQKNLEERSFQVSLMSLVYTGAKEICVWLGEDGDDSSQAIQFVKDEISQLKDFDKLCIDKQHAPKWKALLVLMQRPWFSRRWVVQEIALAERAQVYCGHDQIPWVDLAIAVELFVEVETATHRLSELMKKDDVIPYLFEHVSELGASVLVNATARIFRGHKGDFTRRRHSKKNQVRRSLLSLEYLVTSLSIFDCGRPHDSIYALIAIARDAAPHPPSSLTRRTKEALIAEVFSDAIEQKPYPLDYNSPYPDVCKDFLQFCITGAAKADKVQALDILCRPWAKDWRPKEYIVAPEEKSTEKIGEPEEKIQPILKHEGGWWWKENSDTTKTPDDRNMTKYFEGVEPYIPVTYQGAKEAEEDGVRIPATQRWFPKGVKTKEEKKKKREDGGRKDRKPKVFEPQDIDDLCLPSWVATIAGAAFDIFPHPGMDMVKMGRKNADPLVGTPQDGRRNYNACQLWGVDVKEIKFRRRARLGHYSLYVKGFRFDQVEEVSHVSQAGTIPSAWLDLAKWSKARRTRGPWDDPGDPPDDFWRTLVADRGMHNQNPPYYYMRACKETIMKGGLRGNAVNTSALIYNERNSIVAEFCRRVQAVIWNRALIRTKGGKLGLASDGVRKGDWVCLIYGCTVPVILRKQDGLKTQQEYDREKYEDCIEALRRCIRKAAKGRFRKARYKINKEEKAGWEQNVKSDLKAYDDASKARLRKNEEKIVETLTTYHKDHHDTELYEEMSESESEGDSKRKERQDKAFKMDPFRFYNFIGEAYIHGMMDGEAVREKFYKGKPDHVFELR
ncbi:HET-domain-containing protein [Karstenula rhodostoma CBS 690.94]|uniref:HET-domain-containing protein n=1 Tax=Karstenula rhodostoma CBS 690.94 TaxID=1392251 RepID=A0A9P4PJN4_9PLEO|nr:HET-domain-containing protein [Karstenula rhodostoma CBS 690.94]